MEAKKKKGEKIKWKIMKPILKPEPMGGEVTRSSQSHAEGGVTIFKLPTQVAVTRRSAAHSVERNFHDRTSHDSLGKQDRRRPTNRGAEGKQRTPARRHY